MKVSPFAGQPADVAMLVNVPQLVAAYYMHAPDPSIPGADHLEQILRDAQTIVGGVLATAQVAARSADHASPAMGTCTP